MISAIAHFTIAFPRNESYNQNLKKAMNPYRWYEYAFSSASARLNETLHEEIDDLAQQNTNLKTEVDSISDKADSLSQQNTDLSEQNTNLAEKVDDLTQQINLMNLELIISSAVIIVRVHSYCSDLHNWTPTTRRLTLLKFPSFFFFEYLLN